jgi:hypothetical protein
MISLQTKLKAMLWDIPEPQRIELAERILINPVESFKNDNQLFIKALNSLTWYELLQLVGKQCLYDLLTDLTIASVFPPKRRDHYRNARRLLSKYALSFSGQSA